MTDRQTVEQTEITILKLQIAQVILLALLNASALQPNNFLNPDTIDFVMNAYERIFNRLDEIAPS